MGNDTRSPEVYPYSYSPLPELRGTTGTLREVRRLIAPFRFKLAATQIVRELNIIRGNKVLEIGSGLGLLGKAIKDIVGTDLTYIGIDLVASSLNENKGTLIPTLADTLHLPFADVSFNAIVSTDVLEHVQDAQRSAGELYRVLKPGGKAFIVIADPSEGRFFCVSDHRQRAPGVKTDVDWWETTFKESGFELLPQESKGYRSSDWRKIFNLPFLVRLKDKPGFSCAFNPVNRPGVYILRKTH